MFFPLARLPVSAEKEGGKNNLVFLFTALLSRAECDGRQPLSPRGCGILQK